MQSLGTSGSILTPILLVAATGSLFGQTGAPVQGIPIDHKLTLEKCGGCHPRDRAGMMSRISYMRTTPEVWEQAIKRMIRLNGVTATPAEVREILKYLSNNNGLAPEELEPVFWEVDHSLPGTNSITSPKRLGTFATIATRSAGHFYNGAPATIMKN